MGLKNCYADIRSENKRKRSGTPGQMQGEGGCGMKGYYVSDGYMGYVDGGYRLFADERDYLELMREDEG